MKNRFLLLTLVLVLALSLAALCSCAAEPVIPEDLDVSGITLTDKTVTYDGTEHSLSVSGTLPEGVSVMYVNNGKVNAGEYTVTAKLYYNGHYIEGKDLTAKLIVNKKTVSIDGITFSDSTFIYNGESHSILVEGALPEGVSVAYSGNGKTEVGEYTVTASFVVDEANYAPISETLTAKLTIEEGITPPAPIIPEDLDVSGISLAGKTVTYDGTEHSLAVSGTLPEGVSVMYVNNGKVNAGEYTVTAKLYYNGHYIEGKDLTAKLTIEKKTVTLGDLVFNDTVVLYDGNSHSIAVEGVLPEGVVVVYDGNGKTDAGEYTVTASFVVDEDNYNPISTTLTAKLTVMTPSLDTNAIKFNEATFEFDGNEHSLTVEGLSKLPSYITFIGYEGNGETLVGEYTVTAKFAIMGEYEPELDMTAQLIITKATINASLDNSSVQYVFDGGLKNPPALKMDAAPVGVSVVTVGGAKRLPGVYTTTYKFVIDEDYKNCYYTKEDITVTMTIIDNPNISATEGLIFEDNTSGTVYVAGYTGTSPIVIIPETYDGKTVNAIKYGAFSGNTTIEYVKVPDTVVAIGQAAFRGCTSLDTITLPFVGGSHNSSNEYLGYIFGASGYVGNIQFVPASLKVVDLSSACKVVPAYSFYGCEGINEVRLGGVVEICSNAFRGCTGLTEIRIPETLTKIQADANNSVSPFFLCDKDLVIYLEADSIPETFGSKWNVYNSEGDTLKVVISAK